VLCTPISEGARCCCSVCAVVFNALCYSFDLHFFCRGYQKRQQSVCSLRSCSCFSVTFATGSIG
jgi:hypothetical protein